MVWMAKLKNQAIALIEMPNAMNLFFAPIICSQFVIQYSIKFRVFRIHTHKKSMKNWNQNGQKWQNTEYSILIMNEYRLHFSLKYQQINRLIALPIASTETRTQRHTERERKRKSEWKKPIYSSYVFQESRKNYKNIVQYTSDHRKMFDCARNTDVIETSLANRNVIGNESDRINNAPRWMCGESRKKTNHKQTKK